MAFLLSHITVGVTEITISQHLNGVHVNMQILITNKDTFHKYPYT